MKVVHVEWVDPAFASSGWMMKDEFQEWIRKGIAQSDSVGVLAYENDELVVIVQSIGVGQVADAVKINRACIRSIKELGDVPITLDIDD